MKPQPKMCKLAIRVVSSFILIIITILACVLVLPLKTVNMNFMTDRNFNFTSSGGICSMFKCYDSDKQCWSCAINQRWFFVRVAAPHRANILMSFQDLSITPPFGELDSYMFYGQNYEARLYRGILDRYILAAWSGHQLSDTNISRLRFNIDGISGWATILWITLPMIAFICVLDIFHVFCVKKPQLQTRHDLQ